MIYGNPIVTRESDVTDLIGIRTLVLGQSWQPSSSTLTQDQIDAEAPPIPAVSSGLLLVGTQNRPVGGFYRSFWTFEGVNGNGKTVTFKDRNNSFDYGFEPGFSQMEIQKHPYFQQMLTQYGGYPDVESGRVIWPPFYPAANTGTIGLAGSTGNSQIVNPMFDFKDFFSMEGNYHHRYAGTSQPADLYDDTGLIFETEELPGDPPKNLPDDRNWLKLPPTYKRRGLIYEFVENYWLSGRGGWPVPIYTTPSGSGGSSWPAPTS